ncbi:methionine adenosyltransferase [Candidatus Bathyarchaeota archaeon]|nr:methionine adenosyltransferase [Candidatus Bathyarchaeota archaeon]
MSRNIAVSKAVTLPIEQQALEIVERKGKGHPDTLLDAVVENVGLKLCNYYIDNFGGILHHNVDKGSIAGGRARVTFGGGELLEPIYICVVGRATTEIFKDEQLLRIPLGTLTLSSMKNTLKKTLRFLDPTEQVIMDYRIKPGSADLTHVFDQSVDDIPRANDTSFGVAFAPFSETETIVYETEHLLNSDAFKKKLPEVGEDVKVMGLRTEGEIKLTVAAAMIAHLIPDADHYHGILKDVENAVLDQARKITDREVGVVVNSADDPMRGMYYLTITGTSAEMGDDAGVGRGNRANGLITPCRPMSLEATAGKNPQNHVGKIYNVLAGRMANRIIVEEPRVSEIAIKILTRIGYPIDQPLIASAEVIPDEKTSWNAVKKSVTAIMDAELEDVCSVQQLILDGKASLF